MDRAQGQQQQGSFFTPLTPGVVVTSREGVPSDLEARLHSVWLRSQLNAAGSKNLGNSTPHVLTPIPPVSFPSSQPIQASQPSLTKPDLHEHSHSSSNEHETSKLPQPIPLSQSDQFIPIGSNQQLPSTSMQLPQAPSIPSPWKVDSPFSPSLKDKVHSELSPSIHQLWSTMRSSSGVSISTEESLASAEGSIDLQFMLNVNDPGEGLDLQDEDLFKGLEDLSGAFEEFEQLVPEGPGGFQSPVLTTCNFTSPAPVADSQNLTHEQLAFLQEFIDDMKEQESVNVGVEKESAGLWNGIAPPSSEHLDKVKTTESQERIMGKKRTFIEHGDEASSAESSGNRSSVPRTNSAQAGAQAVAKAGVASAAEAVTEGLNPVNLLVEIAQAVVKRDQRTAHKHLEQLHGVASIYGDASQRLSAYFLEGLIARISGEMPKDHRALIQPSVYQMPDCTHHVMHAFQALVAATPYLTFGQVAVNCALLESFAGAKRVHIIDFGIGHGLQWPPLFQALGVRPGGPPHVRLTAIDLPTHGLKRAYCIEETGARLKEVAKQHFIELEYHPIPSRLENVLPEHIELREGEVVAVNCSLRLHQLLDETATPSNPRQVVLRTIRALNPSIYTVVVQQTNQNSPFFLSRFYEALYYYSGLFDSMDASVPDHSPERLVFEQQVLGKSIVNVVACEGQNRVERQEPLCQWQARMRNVGFRQRPLSINVKGIVQELLTTYRSGYGLQVHDEASLMLTWHSVPLLAMSTWEPHLS